MHIDDLYERYRNAHSDQEVYSVAREISDYCKQYNDVIDRDNYGGWLYRAWRNAPSDYEGRETAAMIADYCRDYNDYIDNRGEKEWRALS